MVFRHRYVLSCLRRNHCALVSSGKRWICHNPLRILFCGSDQFSIHSLKALDKLHRDQPERISDITILCRPDKHIGRGLKEIRAQPIKIAAKELDLEIIELDTFKGWKADLRPIDLIVTVSFGLLVPESIIKLARYGGINVHPSLLPQFRGAAPIQHALIHRVERTGVSIQTMHPTKFDHGIVLDQEEIVLDHSSSTTTQQLLQQLTPIGANLLVRTIQEKLFIDPKPMAGLHTTTNELLKAPRITKLDRRIDWEHWTADDILTRDRALDNLWDEDTIDLVIARKRAGDERSQGRRLVYHGPWSLVPPKSVEVVHSIGRLHLIKPMQRPDDHQLALKTSDGELILPSSATIESQSKAKGWRTLLGHVQQSLAKSQEMPSI